MNTQETQTLSVTTGHDIIVIGASAGGVEALTTLVQGLPADLAASLFVVLHVPQDSPSLLPTILNRHSLLPVQHPKDGDRIKPGQIYIAPPDRHLLVERGFVRVVHGPKENRHRPAVDPLFRTAARAYGPRVIGVILTGALDDGTAGLLAVKRRGGLAVVQSLDDALYIGMPRSAMQNVEVDYSLPVAQISDLLARLVNEPSASEADFPMPEGMDKEAKMAELNLSSIEEEYKTGQPSAFSCPECGGVLWELHDEHLTRYRCRVGHTFSTESILFEQSAAVEQAMWVAFKTLEEKNSMLKRLSDQSKANGQTWLAKRYEDRINEGEQYAKLLQEVLLKNLSNNKLEDLVDYTQMQDTSLPDSP